MRYQEPIVKPVGTTTRLIAQGSGDKSTTMCADSGHTTPNDPTRTSGAYEVDE